MPSEVFDDRTQFMHFILECLYMLRFRAHLSISGALLEALVGLNDGGAAGSNDVRSLRSTEELANHSCTSSSCPSHTSCAWLSIVPVAERTRAFAIDDIRICLIERNNSSQAVWLAL
eukprot:6185199-Pleurochrysis_carterae.AAC.5